MRISAIGLSALRAIARKETAMIENRFPRELNDSTKIDLSLNRFYPLFFTSIKNIYVFNDTQIVTFKIFRINTTISQKKYFWKIQMK